MDPESTGWENIIFRCAFMGMSFREGKRLSPAIAEFSGLGEYLNLPARTYSTGMFLRLAFAISTSIEPEILIMDEMISACDAQFIEKAERRLHEVVDKANILVLASHDMEVIQESATKLSGWSTEPSSSSDRRSASCRLMRAFMAMRWLNGRRR